MNVADTPIGYPNGLDPNIQKSQNVDNIESGVTSINNNIDNTTRQRILYALQRAIPDLPKIITELTNQKHTTPEFELNNIVDSLIGHVQIICSQPASLYTENDYKLRVLNAEIDYVKELYIQNSGGLQSAIDDLKVKYSNCSRLLDNATKSLYRTNADLNNLNVSQKNSDELTTQITTLQAEAVNLKNVISQMQTERDQMLKSMQEMSEINESGQRQKILRSEEAQAKERRDIGILLRVINPESTSSDIDEMLTQIHEYLISTNTLRNTIEKLERDLTVSSNKYKETSDRLIDCANALDKNETEKSKLQFNFESKIKSLRDENAKLMATNSNAQAANDDLTSIYERTSSRIKDIIDNSKPLSTDDVNSKFLHNLLQVLYNENLSFVVPSDILIYPQNPTANDNDAELVTIIDSDNNDGDGGIEDDNNVDNEVEYYSSQIPRTPGSNIKDLDQLISINSPETPPLVSASSSPVNAIDDSSIYLISRDLPPTPTIPILDSPTISTSNSPMDESYTRRPLKRRTSDINEYESVARKRNQNETVSEVTTEVIDELIITPQSNVVNRDDDDFDNIITINNDDDSNLSNVNNVN